MSHPIPFAIVMGYLVVTIGIAVLLRKRVKGSEHYLIAARSLPWFLVIAVLVGEWIGAGTVIGVSQGGYTEGFTAFLYNIGMAIAVVIFTLTLAVRYRRTGAMTVPQIVESLFDRRTGWLSTAIIFLAYFIVTVITIVGGGVILELLLGVPYNLALGLTTAVFILIAVLGGLVSVSITNVMHLVFIILGVGITLFFGLRMAGGWDGLQATLPRDYFSFTASEPQMWTGEILSVVLGFIAAQALVMAILAGKNPRASVQGSIGAAVIFLPIGFMCALVGMTARVIFGDTLPHGLSAGPAVALALNPYLAGLAMCGLWAAIISTGPPIVLSLAQLTIRDIYRGIINPNAPDERVLRYSKIVTVVLGAIAFLFSLYLADILTAIYWIFAIRAGIGALILMVTYLGMRRVTESGAFWGLLAGLTALICWTIADNPYDIHEVYPMVGSTVVVTLIVSTFKKRRARVPDHIAESFKLRD